MPDLSKYMSQLLHALLSRDRAAAEGILAAASQESSTQSMIEDLLTPALEQFGTDWTHNKGSLFDVYMSSRICDELMRPFFLSDHFDKVNSQTKIAIAALLDFHLLGKKLVQLILRATGYDILDYGQGISVADLHRRVQTDQIDVLLISTLMLPSALKIKDVRHRLDQTGIQTKIIVGGAPFRFDPDLWKEVGADAMGAAASDILKIIPTFLLKESSHAA